MIAYGRSACIGVSIAMFFTTVSSSAIESEWGAGTLARMRLFAAVSALPPAGPADVAIEIRIPAGWKTYWQIPGPSGVSTRIDWRESENVESMELQWPAPKRLLDPKIPWLSSIGYREGMTLLARITPKDRDKPVTFVAEAELGVCDDVCIVDYVTTRLLIAASDGESLPASDSVPSFVQSLIQPNGAGGLSIARVYRDKDGLIVETYSAAGFDDPDLFAHSDDPICNEQREFVERERHATRFRLPALCAVAGTMMLTLVDRGEGVTASLPILAMQ